MIKEAIQEQHVARDRQGGFTMIEMSIVMTILVPLMVGIAVTTSSVNDTMEANSRRADVMTYCRRMSQRIAKLVRPAQMTTIQVQAVQLDVTMLRAAAIGEWIAPRTWCGGRGSSSSPPAASCP